MKNPDELGPVVDNNEVDNEVLEYVAVNVLEQRGVEEDPQCPRLHHMLAGHQQEIQAERDRKLGAAKEQRKNRRQGAA
jgi:hypothetical protein